MKKHGKTWLCWFPVLAFLVVTGCGGWDKRVENAQRKWFNKTFPHGMTFEEFKEIAPDAYRVGDKNGQTEYVALVKRTCFAVCATLDGGLRSRDLLDARFFFEDGHLKSKEIFGKY